MPSLCQTEDVFARFWIQRRGVLVEKHDPRRGERGHDQADRLPLPTRQHADQIAEAIFEAEADQCKVKPFPLRFGKCRTEPTRPRSTRCQRHILLNGQRVACSSHRILENARYQARTAVGWTPRNIDIVDQNCPAFDRNFAGNGIEQRGFPRSVGADHGDELSSLDTD